MAWPAILAAGAALAPAVMGAMKGGRGGSVTAAYQGINTPDPELLKLQLEQYVQQGILTPEDATAIMADPTAFSDISIDPALKDAQRQALASLSDVASSGGLNAQSRARLGQIASEEAQRERSNRDAILQNAAQRGTVGSGNQLLAQLVSGQGAASRESQRGMDVAALGEQQALNAIINQGNLAGNIRGQDFNEQAKIAEAKDIMNKFNTANRQDVLNRNVAARNAAQLANLNAKQTIANANVDQRNTQQEYNKKLQQQEFENKLRLAGGKSGAAGQAASINAQADVRRDNTIGNIIKAGGAMFGNFYNQPNDDEKLRTSNYRW